MSRMATIDAFLNTQVQKRPCKYHFVGQFEIAFPGLCMSYASQKRSSTHANFHAFRRPCFPSVLVPGLLTPTSIFGMNHRDARCLAVRGENFLFWPLS